MTTLGCGIGLLLRIGAVHRQGYKTGPQPPRRQDVSDKPRRASAAAQMHISHILAKLGLPSRTLLAVWAAEQGAHPPSG
jgi:hypothetical protein